LFTDAANATRNFHEIKVMMKTLVQYCRTVFLQGAAVLSAAELPLLFDLLLGFCTYRPSTVSAGEAAVACPRDSGARRDAVIGCCCVAADSGRGSTAVVPSFVAPSPVDLTFVQEFLRIDVADTAPAAVRQMILDFFLRQFVQPTVPDEIKALGLRFIVTPMLAKSLVQSTGDVAGADAAASAAAAPAEAANVLSPGGEFALAAPNSAARLPMVDMLLSPASGQGVSAAATPRAAAQSATPRSVAGAAGVAAGAGVGAGTDAADVVMDGGDGGAADASGAAEFGAQQVTFAVASSRFIDGDVVNRIVSTLLSGDGQVALSEALRTELLQLSTLLIDSIAGDLMDHRKNLIKFAWQHLKSDDVVSKHWAYVNVCRFIEAFDTPSKIILQVYVALLRTYQPSCKDLVRVALDRLTRSLPVRLPPIEQVRAVKWTRKIVVRTHVVYMICVFRGRRG
jgi:hypothetical protein